MNSVITTPSAPPPDLERILLGHSALDVLEVAWEKVYTNAPLYDRIVKLAEPEKETSDGNLSSVYRGTVYYSPELCKDMAPVADVYLVFPKDIRRGITIFWSGTNRSGEIQEVTNHEVKLFLLDYLERQDPENISGLSIRQSDPVTRESDGRRVREEMDLVHRSIRYARDGYLPSGPLGYLAANFPVLQRVLHLGR